MIFALSFTIVNTGLIGFVCLAIVLFTTIYSPEIVFVEPSAYVNVTSPSFPTVTAVPSGKSGLAFPISIATLSFSSCMMLVTSSTSVNSGLTGVLLAAIPSSTTSASPWFSGSAQSTSGVSSFSSGSYVASTTLSSSSAYAIFSAPTTGIIINPMAIDTVATAVLRIEYFAFLFSLNIIFSLINCQPVDYNTFFYIMKRDLYFFSNFYFINKVKLTNSKLTSYKSSFYTF